MKEASEPIRRGVRSSGEFYERNAVLGDGIRDADDHERTKHVHARSCTYQIPEHLIRIAAHECIVVHHSLVAARQDLALET